VEGHQNPERDQACQFSLAPDEPPRCAAVAGVMTVSVAMADNQLLMQFQLLQDSTSIAFFCYVHVCM
jgi:hypothetical protein